jgi:hypothetical protein
LLWINVLERNSFAQLEAEANTMAHVFVTHILTILCKECRPSPKVDPTSHDIARGEWRTVLFAVSAGAKGCPVIAMIAPGFTSPAREFV